MGMSHIHEGRMILSPNTIWKKGFLLRSPKSIVYSFTQAKFALNSDFMIYSGF